MAVAGVRWDLRNDDGWTARARSLWQDMCRLRRSQDACVEVQRGWGQVPLQQVCPFYRHIYHNLSHMLSPKDTSASSANFMVVLIPGASFYRGVGAAVKLSLHPAGRDIEVGKRPLHAACMTLLPSLVLLCCRQSAANVGRDGMDEHCAGAGCAYTGSRRGHNAQMTIQVPTMMAGMTAHLAPTSLPTSLLQTLRPIQ